MNSEYGILGVLLLSGVVGSLRHCLGMCGPMVTMCGAQPRFSGSVMVSFQLLYHGSRIATYAALGAILGGVGSLLGLGRGLSGLASAVSIAVGVGVLILGLGYVGWLSGRGLGGTRAWWTRAVLKALGRTGPSRIMLLGMLNGLDAVQPRIWRVAPGRLDWSPVAGRVRHDALWRGHGSGSALGCPYGQGAERPRARGALANWRDSDDCRRFCSSRYAGYPRLGSPVSGVWRVATQARIFLFAYPVGTGLLEERLSATRISSIAPRWVPGVPRSQRGVHLLTEAELHDPVPGFCCPFARGVDCDPAATE